MRAIGSQALFLLRDKVLIDTKQQAVRPFRQDLIIVCCRSIQGSNKPPRTLFAAVGIDTI